MRCRYQQNERKYDGVLQRGWYRGFVFNADFPVPDSAVAVLGLFYFTDKESSRLTSLVLFFFMGDTVSGDLPPPREKTGSGTGIEESKILYERKDHYGVHDWKDRKENSINFRYS